MILTWAQECRERSRFSDAKNKFVLAAVRAVAPEAEHMHGQWCGPKWEAAESADAAARAEWVGRYGWGWRQGWDGKVLREGADGRIVRRAA